MMLKASEAKRAAKVYYDKLVSDHAVEYKRTAERERKQAEKIWVERGEELVEKIEGWITHAAVKGQHVTFEPTDVNPGGDEVIYLKDSDLPIYKMVMDYFRRNGFTV